MLDEATRRELQERFSDAVQEVCKDQLLKDVRNWLLEEGIET